MSVLEKDIEGKVVSWANNHGFLSLKVRFQESGYPDRLFISPQGHTIFIEFKRPGESPSQLQLYRIRCLKGRNIPAYWTDNSVTAISILKAALEPEAVPDKSNKAPTVTSIRRAVAGPRLGKDFDLLGSFEDTKAERDDPEGPDYSAGESDL